MKPKNIVLSTLCLATSLLVARERELIQKLYIKKNYLEVRLHDDIQKKYLTEDFFVEYEQDIDLEAMPYEIATMPVIMNVIGLIWVSGKTFYIDSMEEELYQSLKTIKKLIQVINPNTKWRGKLKPRKRVSLAKQFAQMHEESRKAILYSGGLDSTSSFLDHIHEKLLTITGWGAFDLPLDQQHIWDDRKEKTVRFTQKYGQASTFLKSNYYDFLNLTVVNNLSSDIDGWRYAAVEGIGWAGLAAPIMASKGCSTLLIPSSTSWEFPYSYVGNPFIDNSIRFAGFTLHHDQFHLTRFGKNEAITRTCKENNLDKPFIKVCQWTQEQDDNNCCDCRKCLTTIMGFLALNENPEDYGFPISAKKAVSHTLTLLKDKERRGHFDVCNFYVIQKYLRERQRNGVAVAEELLPFMEYDLMKVKTSDRKHIRRTEWSALYKIAPIVAIPTDIGENAHIFDDIS